MLRLMIVDDEKTTRESLERYIPWAALSVGPVLTARNGAEALALAAEAPPDILLTDVRMPRMDGMALARRIREMCPSCKIVFISGYADKEYLKTAIRLQAVSYIEKPIDPAEVTEVVHSAVAAWEQEARATAESERLRREHRESVCLVREQIVRRVVGGCASPGELRSAFGETLPDFEDGTSFTAAAAALRWERTVPDGEKEGIRHRMLVAAGGLAPFAAPTTMMGFVQPGVLAVVVARKVLASMTTASPMYQSLADALRAVAAGSVSTTIGIGEPTSGWQGIARSFDEALAVTALSFYRDGDSLVWSCERPASSFSLDTEIVPRVRACLRDGDVDEVRVLVRCVSEQARATEPTDVDSVRDAFFALHEAIRTSTAPPPLESRMYVWQAVRDSARLDELVDLVERLLPADAGRGGAVPRRILEVQRYIRCSYADPNLALQSIAARAGLSRTYLSALFKSVTGTNLNDYITQVRLDRARELLRDGGLRTNEVAARVGYQDANYFSALFKKHVGLTPTEYRDGGEGERS